MQQQKKSKKGEEDNRRKKQVRKKVGAGKKEERERKREGGREGGRGGRRERERERPKTTLTIDEEKEDRFLHGVIGIGHQAIHLERQLDILVLYLNQLPVNRKHSIHFSPLIDRVTFTCHCD